MPDNVVTSSAVRARRTLELAAKAGEWACTKRVSERLYAASPADVLTEIKAEPDTSQTLMIVGHEPTCSGLIGSLAGGAQVRFSTAAMARLDLPIQRWRDAAFGAAQLIWIVTPKLVKKMLKAGASG